MNNFNFCDCDAFITENIIKKREIMFKDQGFILLDKNMILPSIAQARLRANSVHESKLGLLYINLLRCAKGDGS